MEIARRVFELQLDRAHILATLAAARELDLSEPDGDDARTARMREIERELMQLDHETLPMRRLAVRLGLNEAERRFTWMATAMAADPRLLPHGHALVGSAARRGLSLSLYSVFAGVGGAEGRELALRLTSAHPLRDYHLLEDAEPSASLPAVALRASACLISYLSGTEELDEALRGLAGEPELPDEVIFDDRQQRSLRRLADGLAAATSLVVLIEGPDGSGRRTAAAHTAAGLERRVVALDIRRLPASEGALEAALVGLRRDCLLREAVPLIANIDDLSVVEPAGGSAFRTLSRAVDSFDGTVILTSARPGLDLALHRNLLRVDWSVADAATRRRVWRQVLGPDAAALDDALGGLALRYRLGPGDVERAAAAARIIGKADGDGPVQAGHLVAGVRNNIAERLGTLARRVEVAQTWDDLVLSTDILDQLHGLVARVRHAYTVYQEWGFDAKAARGIGVAALFSGPPGTGKTMVAGIIARELDLEMLQVDLSQVVSKWVGETEKQLSRLFDAAEAGHSLLLFDEADALFAKRTEVKGATDRYANLEVNYLLQRVESFGGITILTTNMDTSIDAALKRRLACQVSFWPPDEDERLVLWQRLLTTRAAPLADDLDLEELAREFPDMTGANIRNAVLSAAFLAAAETSSISQSHLLRAARGEYRTMGRILR